MTRRRPSTYAVAVIVALIASFGAWKAYEAAHTANRAATQARVDARQNSREVAQIKALTAELKKSVQSPTHGKDIAVWCGFDQSIEADLHAYIGQFHGHAPALKLPSLNCAAIEAGEAASTKTKH